MSGTAERVVLRLPMCKHTYLRTYLWVTWWIRVFAGLAWNLFGFCFVLSWSSVFLARYTLEAGPDWIWLGLVAERKAAGGGVGS